MKIQSSQRVNNRKHSHLPSDDNNAVDEDGSGSDSSYAAMIDNHQAAAAISVADYDLNDYNESDTNNEDAGLQGYELVILNSRSGSISGGGDNDSDGNNGATVMIPPRINNGLNKDKHYHHHHRCRSSRDHATKQGECVLLTLLGECFILLLTRWYEWNHRKMRII